MFHSQLSGENFLPEKLRDQQKYIKKNKKNLFFILFDVNKYQMKVLRNCHDDVIIVVIQIALFYLRLKFFVAFCF